MSGCSVWVYSCSLDDEIYFVKIWLILIELRLSNLHVRAISEKKDSAVLFYIINDSSSFPFPLCTLPHGQGTIAPDPQLRALHASATRKLCRKLRFAHEPSNQFHVANPGPRQTDPGHLFDEQTNQPQAFVSFIPPAFLESLIVLIHSRRHEHPKESNDSTSSFAWLIRINHRPACNGRLRS